MGQVYARPAPIEGQSHWCEGGRVNGTVCWQVVANGSDHCERGHPNEVVSVSEPELGEVPARQDNLSAYSLSKMVDGRVPEVFTGAEMPPSPLGALTWDQLVAEMKREGRVIGVPGRGGPDLLQRRNLHDRLTDWAGNARVRTASCDS